MSVNYASGLSNYAHIHKGKLGLPEVFDSSEVLETSIKELTKMIKESKYCVMHTGAGISTSAGIPDFRGPTGVWTLESKGLAPSVNISFEQAVPTKTHLAILALQQCGMVKYLVSQNIDGLHVRSGYPRSRMSELHGNMFVEKCEKCFHEYFRRYPVSTMTQKPTGNMCTQKGKRGINNCRGKLRDTILDWEDSLPVPDLLEAEIESRKADLSICLGTTLQIVPSGKIPLLTLKNKTGKLVIINLQKTKYDKKASLLIHHYVDVVMEGVMKELGMTIPSFCPDLYHSITTVFESDPPYMKKGPIYQGSDTTVQKTIMDSTEEKDVKCEDSEMKKCEDSELEKCQDSEVKKCEGSEVKEEEVDEKVTVQSANDTIPSNKHSLESGVGVEVDAKKVKITPSSVES